MARGNREGLGEMTVDLSGSVSELPLRQPRLEQRAVQQREVELIRNAFRSPRGQQALQVLRELFDHPAAYYPDPALMQFFEGQRSVVDYIEEAMDERST